MDDQAYDAATDCEASSAMEDMGGRDASDREDDFLV